MANRRNFLAQLARRETLPRTQIPRIASRLRENSGQLEKHEVEEKKKMKRERRRESRPMCVVLRVAKRLLFAMPSARRSRRRRMRDARDAKDGSGARVLSRESCAVRFFESR